MMRDNELKRFSKPGDPPVLLFADRNAYLPRRAIIQNITAENSLVRTYEIVFEDAIYNTDFMYLPGQFMMLSLPHCGEAPFSFSSSPTRPSSFSLTIRRAGKLTSACDELRIGDMVGVRGPYGRSFPLDDLVGSDLLFVAGGIGMAPLRSVIGYCLDRRADYGDITLLYGCRSPDEFCFRQDLSIWQETPGVSVLQTVDAGDAQWTGRIGLVTKLLDEVAIDAQKTTALVCGPGIMIRFVIERLLALGLPPERIITTLERHMKCGIGICGHCHFENRMICTEGPVFYAAELTDLETI